MQTRFFSFLRQRMRLSPMLLLNIVLISLVFVLFECMTHFSSSKLNAERRASQEALLEHVASQLAEQNLAFYRLCTEIKSDHNACRLMLYPSDRRELSEVVDDAMRMLSIASASSPCISSIYLYSASTDKAYSSRGLVMMGSTATQNLTDLLAPQETLPQLSTLEETYCFYQKFLLYSMPAGTMGKVVLHVNTADLLNSGSFASDFPGYQLVVLSRGGRLVLSSYPAHDLNALGDVSWAALENESKICLGGTNMSVLRADLIGLDSFSVLLLCDDSYINAANQIENKAFFLMLAALVIVNLSLLLGNTWSHRPLLHLARKYGARSSHEVIPRIGEIIDRYSTSNGMLYDRIRSMMDVQWQLSLAYIMADNNAMLPDALSAQLARRLSRYFVLCLAQQKRDGSTDASIFSLAEELLQTEAVMTGACQCVFIVSDEISRETAIAALRESFAAEGSDGLSWAGVSDRFDSAQRLSQAVKQAYERMMGLPACPDAPLSLADADSRRPQAAVSPQLYSELSRLSVLGAVNPEAVEALLLADGKASLAEMHLNRQLLIALCRTVLATASLETPQELDEVSSEHFVHYGYYADRFWAILHRAGQTLSPEKQTLAGEIIRYLNEHYAEPLTLHSIADAVHLSPQYLSMVFKKTSGVNLFVYLSALRMNKAEELLKNYPSMKIRDISAAVGIDTPNTFTRQFKMHFGVTPEQYRKQM